MRYRLLGYIALAWMVSVPSLYAAEPLKKGAFERSPQSQYSSKPDEKTNLSASDQSLKTKIQTELQAMPLDTKDITFEVKNGKVTLHGQTDDIENLQMIEDRLQNNVEGIMIIDNQIEIKSAGPQTQRWYSRDILNRL